MTTTVPVGRMCFHPTPHSVGSWVEEGVSSFLQDFNRPRSESNATGNRQKAKE